jgi:hypothetical protein
MKSFGHKKLTFVPYSLEDPSTQSKQLQGRSLKFKGQACAGTQTPNLFDLVGYCAIWMLLFKHASNKKFWSP